MKKSVISTLCAVALGVPAISVIASDDTGPALENRTTQSQITDGSLSLTEIRRRGMLLFSTPFNKADGFGETPGETPEARREVGSRGSLQGNGKFTRINGLDAQACLECHSVISRATIPMKFAVGGVGGVNNTVLGGGGASFINVNDDENQINPPAGGPTETTGANNINGRTINPPFVFGSGGVELVGNEMTADLQALRQQAVDNPNTVVNLVTKGVNFGTLSFDGEDFDTSGVEGIEADASSDKFLVVQPFGRTGDNITTRQFDIGAMQFHFGMQPDEVLDPGRAAADDGNAVTDGDGDGVTNEILIGELSALNIFSALLERPRQRRVTSQARRGEQVFNDVGCAECHVPTLSTTTRKLGVRYPEIANDPSANVYKQLDLSRSPTRFKRNRSGGIDVRLFADLKSHDMGPALAEFNGNQEFTTARLWGVADTAPYLHDGRAFTLTEAINIHGQTGSDAETAVANFNGQSSESQEDLIAFLKTLRTPRVVGRGLRIRR